MDINSKHQKLINDYDKINENFKHSRKEIGKQLYEIASNIKFIEKIADVECDALSLRHNITERLYTHRALCEEFDAYLVTFRANELDEIKNNHRLKFDGWSEMNILLQKKVLPIEKLVKLLKHQITFYEQCVYSLNKVSYSIKNRLNIYNIDGI